jgi:transcriptional regulator with XRE-family HTH domain
MSDQPTTLDLTPGEAFHLQRRRAGRTQQQAAEDHGVSTKRVGAWEADEREDCPEVSLGNVTSAEWCIIQRTRRGVTVRQLAKELGLSPAWISRAENGTTNVHNLQALVAHWERVEAQETSELAEVVAEARGDSEALENFL